MEVKPILRRFGASLILVTHPRKGTKGTTSTLDDLGGGAAYSRFSQTVLWLKQHKPAKEVTIKLGSNSDVAGVYPMTISERVNRTLLVAKSRNGPGSGWSIAMNLQGGTLRFIERGIVIQHQAGQIVNDDAGNSSEESA